MQVNPLQLQHNPDMAEQITVQVKTCARCGQDHPAKFQRFQGEPILITEDGETQAYNWFALCPVVGDPILMTIYDVQKRCVSNDYLENLRSLTGERPTISGWQAVANAIKEELDEETEQLSALILGLKSEANRLEKQNEPEEKQV